MCTHESRSKHFQRIYFGTAKAPARMRSLRTYLAAGLLLAACVKDDPAEDVAVADVHSVIDHVFMERCVLSVPALVNTFALAPGTWTQLTANTCASIDSIVGDTASFPAGGPVSIYLSYPDTGCVDLDQHRRSGRYRITLTDLHHVPGAIRSIAGSDLIDNGFRCRFGLRDSTLAPDTFLFSVDSSFMYYAGDWGRRITGAGLYHWTGGQGDDDPLNDTYDLRYSGSGIDRDGRNYTFTTDTAIVLATGCPWSGKGEETHSPDGLATRILDYGSGTCDNQCVIDVEGEPVGLTIP